MYIRYHLICIRYHLICIRYHLIGIRYQICITYQICFRYHLICIRYLTVHRDAYLCCFGSLTGSLSIVQFNLNLIGGSDS